MGTTSAPCAAAIPRPPAVGFVARRDEEGRDIVERLKGNLDPAQQRLVVLWGPGGVGKTTLAAEAVREMAGVFGKRTVWAGAQNRADFNFDTLLDEIATQLGRTDLRQFVTDEKAEQVVALLGESPALVVLDNFETLPTDEQKTLRRVPRRACQMPGSHHHTREGGRHAERSHPGYVARRSR